MRQTEDPAQQSGCERQAEKGNRERDDDAVCEAGRQAVPVRAQDRFAKAGARVVFGCKKTRGNGKPGAEDDLDNRQEGRTLKVEIVADGLIDGEFDGRCLWAAAEGEDDGEARRAQEKNEGEDARQALLQHRPFDMARDGARGHAKLAGEAPLLGGDGEPALQQDAGGKRQVEENMGQQDAADAIERRGFEADRLGEAWQQSPFAPYRQYAEDGDDHWQDEGRTEKRQNGPPARKAACGKGPGQRDRQKR